MLINPESFTGLRHLRRDIQGSGVQTTAGHLLYRNLRLTICSRLSRLLFQRNDWHNRSTQLLC